MIAKIINLNKQLSYKFLPKEDDIDNKFEKMIIDLSLKSKSIFELGGVSRPVLKKSTNYEYIGIDIDDNFEWLEYYDNFYCQSAEDELPGKADLIFSKYLMEHIEDVKKSYNSQLNALSKGGSIIHLYPLGFHPFSILNKLVGNRLGKKFIKLFRKEHQEITGYPAFYDLGNALKLENYFKSKEVNVSYHYHYGALDYFTFFFPAALIISLFNSFCRWFNLKIFASNVLIEIRK